jgi:hypothetical protein
LNGQPRRLRADFGVHGQTNFCRTEAVPYIRRHHLPEVEHVATSKMMRCHICLDLLQSDVTVPKKKASKSAENRVVTGFFCVVVEAAGIATVTRQIAKAPQNKATTASHTRKVTGNCYTYCRVRQGSVKREPNPRLGGEPNLCSLANPFDGGQTFA